MKFMPTWKLCSSPLVQGGLGNLEALLLPVHPGKHVSIFSDNHIYILDFSIRTMFWSMFEIMVTDVLVNMR